MGEIKLQPWRDGFRNLTFLMLKRFGLTQKGTAGNGERI